MGIFSKSRSVVVFLALLQIQHALCFEVRSIFKNPFAGGQTASLSSEGGAGEIKKQLLESISFTNNGKDATLETQRKVLKLVGELEKAEPMSDQLFKDPKITQKIDGPWYLQYTSPSDILTPEESSEDDWKLGQVIDGDVKAVSDEKIPGGSVSASGIKVNTSGRVVVQTIDVEQNTVSNEIDLPFGKLKLAGPITPSEKVATRALVTFEVLEITLPSGPVLDFAFVLKAVSLLKGTPVGGWLETTYVDENLRIGRGNKGTMFVLTKDLDAVKP